MTLDPIDRAFVARWRSRPAAAAGVDGAADVQEPGREAGAGPRSEDAAVTPPDRITAAPLPQTTGLVDRLLASNADQWNSLAAEVEAARLAGHRVIAIAGGERGEGRTTLVACLERVLRGRGRDLVVYDSPVDVRSAAAGPADGGQLHDKRIVLVDAGVWFPPGPIRRHRLLVASLGCDAAILVRRAARSPVPSRAVALAAVGVTTLGEVVTFAPPATVATPPGTAA